MDLLIMNSLDFINQENCMAAVGAGSGLLQF